MRAMLAPLPGVHAAGAQVPLPGAEAALVGLAMAGVALIPFLGRLAEQFETMAHEGAHAIVASAMGFTVQGVILDRDSNGAMWFVGHDGGLGRSLSAMTHLPRRLWAGLRITGTVLAAISAGAWLIHPAPA